MNTFICSFQHDINSSEQFIRIYGVKAENIQKARKNLHLYLLMHHCECESKTVYNVDYNKESLKDFLSQFILTNTYLDDPNTVIIKHSSYEEDSDLEHSALLLKEVHEISNETASILEQYSDFHDVSTIAEELVAKMSRIW